MQENKTMKENKTDEKKPYSPPQVTVHGNVEVITQGGPTGPGLDQTFPTSTPFSSLTFS